MIQKVKMVPAKSNKITRKEAQEIMDQGHEIIVVRGHFRSGVPYICFRCHKDKNGNYYGHEFHSATSNIQTELLRDKSFYVGQGMVMAGWWGYFTESNVTTYSYVKSGEIEYIVKQAKGNIQKSLDKLLVLPS